MIDPAKIYLGMKAKYSNECRNKCKKNFFSEGNRSNKKNTIHLLPEFYIQGCDDFYTVFFVAIKLEGYLPCVWENADTEKIKIFDFLDKLKTTDYLNGEWDIEIDVHYSVTC